jgi:hypothetical protein
MTEMESKEAVSFDLVIECDDEDTQGEVKAECGCTLERAEFTVGLLYCDMHRDAPFVREMLHDAVEYAKTTYSEDEGDIEPHFVAEARSRGIE